MKFNKIDIGNIVREKLLEKKISNAEFGRMINIQRQNVTKTIFEKSSLDTDLLIRISEALNYNFFQHYKADDDCNKINYIPQDVKATLSIEVGTEKKEQVFRFVFGENNIEILNK